jgi:hypothetical protein
MFLERSQYESYSNHGINFVSEKGLQNVIAFQNNLDVLSLQNRMNVVGIIIDNIHEEYTKEEIDNIVNSHDIPIAVKTKDNVTYIFTENSVIPVYNADEYICNKIDGFGIEYPLEEVEPKIINLTPHLVNIVLENEETIKFSPVGNARCKQETKNIGLINGIPITSTSFGEVEGLPEEKEGIYYIVSRLVMSACGNRKDLLVPNDIVRDKEGKIIGCKSLANN